MTVRIPIDVSTTGVENIKKIKDGIAQVKKDIDEIQSKGRFKEEEKVETANNKKIVEAFEKGDFKELTDLEAKVAERVLEKLKGEGVSNTSQVTKKDFNKIVTESKKEVEQQKSKIDKVIEQDLGFSKGNLLDRFFDDRIDNRTDALRSKDQLQRILQGFDSLRISTIDGNSDPRNIYNSFEVFENNRTLLENDFKIRKSIT